MLESRLSSEKLVMRSALAALAVAAKASVFRCIAACGARWREAGALYAADLCKGKVESRAQI